MAHYLFLVLAMAVSAGSDAAQKQIDSLKIVTNAEGVSVEAIGLKALALQATFDNKTGQLVLEGTYAAPVSIEHTVDGHDSRMSAAKVAVSLKTGRTQADWVRLYRSIPKQQTDGARIIPIPHTN